MLEKEGKHAGVTFPPTPFTYMLHMKERLPENLLPSMEREPSHKARSCCHSRSEMLNLVYNLGSHVVENKIHLKAVEFILYFAYILITPVINIIA